MAIDNPYEKDPKRTFFDFLLWVLGFHKAPENLKRAPDDFSYPNTLDELKEGTPTVSWIGHSTFLIHWDGKTFLTDPIWDRPLGFLGPKRRQLPPYPIEKLPKVDYLLISHDHYDHLDTKTVKALLQLMPKLQCIVPHGVKKWFTSHFPQARERTYEMGWWDKKIFDDFEIIGVPAQHFSGRNLFRRNDTLWMGYIVKKGEKKFYFAGDTGYNPVDFKTIGSRFKPIDLCLVPIGSYLPRSFMKPVHIEPKEAVKIHTELQSRLSVAGHFGTFKLSSEDMNRPPYDLFLALQEENIEWKKFRVLSPGQKLNW